MKRTNVLFILTDDQGVWACGCYGNKEIRTPNIDRIATSGMRCDNFFVATPVCSPSRATFLTGRIPSQHGVHDWISGGNIGPDSINYLESEVCYTDLLAQNGWTCGISGKWHLGASQMPQHGFTDWFVHQTGGGDYNNAPVVRQGRRETFDGYITDGITEEALTLLDRYAKENQPFYLSVHYTAPHSPWTGHPQDIVDSYDNCAFESCPQEKKHPWAVWLTDQNLGNRESLKGYFAAVTAMDAGVGRILDRLERLGLRENTLVVFVSDNGFSCGHHGFWGKGNGTNPRNMYENSIKVPAVFSQPGTIAAGSSTAELLCAYDFLPTLLELLHLPVPGDRNLPGQSFAPILQGKPFQPRDHVVIYDEYGPVRMIRTKEWKYVYRHAYGPHELYNLMEDPDERENLVECPEHRKRTSELKEQMDTWFAAYVDVTKDGLAQNGTKHGQERRFPR